MNVKKLSEWLVLGCLASVLLLPKLTVAQAKAAPPKYPDFPSETPAKLVPVTSSFDYEKREVMIRDARWCEAPHRDRAAKRREECSDPVDPHALQRFSEWSAMPPVPTSDRF